MQWLETLTISYENLCPTLFLLLQSGEPSALKRGKAFHKEVQSGWEQTAEGEVRCEKGITKTDGSGGRIDIHVDAGEGLVAVVEVKSTDWTRLSEAQVRRRAREYSEQIWEYVEHELGKGVDVCPGIVLLGMPEDASRVALIEELFGEEGISAVWQDESVEQARARNARASAN